MSDDPGFLAHIRRPAFWITQAKWSIPDLTKSIHAHCRECNGVEVFLDSNDCVSHQCELYPYRPGKCRPEVKGVKRAKRRVSTSTNFVRPDRCKRPSGSQNPRKPPANT